MWDVCWEVGNDFTDRSDLQACADDDDQIDKVLIVIRETLRKSIRELFSEEGDVRLHNACFRDVVVVVGRVGITISATFLVLAILRTLALHCARRTESAEPRGTVVAAGNPIGSDVGEDRFAGDLVLAFVASRSCERTVALNQLLREDTCHRLDVVNILGVIGEEFALLLEQVDEFMCRRVSIYVGEDVLSNLKEDAWIFFE